MHEVGHTLGLSHNFKASSWKPLSTIAATAAEDEQLSASVMDYNAINITLEEEQQGRYLNTTIGPYDYWAIEYGYKIIDAPTPEAEKAELAKITARVAEPALAFASDFDVWSSDPQVNRWDMGSDVLDFAKNRMDLIQKLQEDLVARTVPEGESYVMVRRALDALLFDYSFVGSLAAGYVGGSHIHRDHRGDPGGRDPLVPVEVGKQREALQFVADNVFSESAFQFPPELLRKLAVSKWWHWGMQNQIFQDADYELHDHILTVQLWSLFQLINPLTMRRIHDAELRVPSSEDAMTLPELYSTMTNVIFSEALADTRPTVAFTNRRPLISSVRRNLQREYVAELIGIAFDRKGAYPRSARTLAWDHLRQLGEAIDRSLGTGGQLDDYSASHLRECRELIQRAVEAQYVIPQ